MNNPKPQTRNPKPARSAPARATALDRIIHERVRLAIVSALAASDSLSFNELKGLLQVTDGNLSVHARKLEEAGYVASAKSFEKRMPKTEFRLTAEGRRAFERYVSHLEALIGAARVR
ncbi:MAG TPA: transcriptional regulator [Thermoanaerobaculia bacterium]|nr:transcriptional regulator [Thermoanaerobaculia bacterium]